jgi:DNA-binding NarL/FixJ family response regulator
MPIEPEENPTTVVWVVEDNDRYRRILAKMIDQMKGFICDLNCDNAEEAIEAMHERASPDVLLLDIGLPGINGIEAMQKIQSQIPSVKIIILTAFNDRERVFQAISAGADGYLLKTSSAESIETAIYDVLDGGASVSPEVARQVLDQFKKRSKERVDGLLTDREHDVLKLMVEGLTKGQIAEDLDLSTHTVDSHLRNIYLKLQVRNRAAAVAAAIRDGLV